MKLSPKMELTIASAAVCLVTLILIVAKLEKVSFDGFVLNKWTVLVFYLLAVAEFIHIKLKGSKSCKSSCQASEPPPGPQSS